MYVVDIRLSAMWKRVGLDRMQLNATHGEEKRVEIEDGCQHTLDVSSFFPFPVAGIFMSEQIG